jgi:hypothetical protein
VATQTRAPTSDITATGTWTGTAGTRYALVDDYPDTSGVDVLTHGTTVGLIQFGFSPFTVPALATGISFRVVARARRNAGGSSNLAARITFNNGNVAVGSSVSPGASYGTHTWSWGTGNPSSVAAWTVDEINGIGPHGIASIGFVSTDATPTISIAAVQAEIDFNQTISFDAGTYALSGSNPSLAKSLVGVVDAGTYGYAGADIDLAEPVTTVGFVSLAGLEAGGFGRFGDLPELAFNRGFLDITFAPVSGYTTRALSVTPESYALTGPAVTTTAARQSALTSAQYDIGGVAGGEYAGLLLAVLSPMTGRPVSFNKGYSLAIDPATHSLTGASQTLSIGYAVSTSGVYALTGSNPNLFEGTGGFLSLALMELGGAGVSPQLSLSIDPGAYAQTGADTSLAYGHQLSVDPAAYTVTGADVAFNEARTPGFFSLLALEGGGGGWAFADEPIHTFNNGNPLAWVADPGYSSTYAFHQLGLAPSSRPSNVPDMIIDSMIYTVTPSNIGLTVQRAVRFDAGAYVQSGQPISLTTPAKTLSVDAASYVVTGRPVDTTHQGVVSFNAGTYALAGSAVTLPLTKALGFDAGTYAVTGPDVEFEYGNPGNVAPGSYTVTGSNTTLSIGYSLSVSPGSYALTGAAVSFRATFLGFLNAETYEVTGAAATLAKHFVVSQTAGAYAVTGADINLAVVSPGDVEAGHYDLLGANPTLLVDRSMSISEGAYALTGSDVSFTTGVSEVIDFGPGAYTLTGSAKTLAFGHSMTVDPGAYSLTGSDLQASITKYAIAFLADSYSISGSALTLDFQPLNTVEVEPVGVGATFSLGSVTVVGYNDPNWTPQSGASGIWTPRGANTPKTWTPENTGEA